MKLEKNAQETKSIQVNANANNCCNFDVTRKPKFVWFWLRFLFCGGVLFVKWNWMYYFIFLFRYITSLAIIVAIAIVFWMETDNNDEKENVINSNVIDNDLIAVLICVLLDGIPTVCLVINILHIRNAIVITFTVTPDRTATQLVIENLNGSHG